jgi:hypothetical protein
MALIAGIVATVGALITLWGSVWLWRGFGHDNPRYQSDGQLYPGEQRPVALINLLRDQRKVTALIAFGGAVQLVGTCLALVAVVQSSGH